MPFPYAAAINVSSPQMANSIYHSMLINLEKRMSSSLVLLASFTYGKLISDSIKAHTFAAGFREGVNVGIDYERGLQSPCRAGH